MKAVALFMLSQIEPESRFSTYVPYENWDRETEPALIPIAVNSDA